MSTTESENLFAVISVQMAELARLADSESGDKIRPIGHSSGVIPDVVRTCVNTIADILEWLYQVSKEAENFIVVADAVIASLELMADAIDALGEGLEFGEISSSLGLAAEPFQKIGGAISKGGEAMKDGLKYTQVLPTPEDIRDIQTEIEKCLGTRVRENIIPATPGALGQLLEDIAATT